MRRVNFYAYFSLDPEKKGDIVLVDEEKLMADGTIESIKIHDSLDGALQGTVEDEEDE